MYSNSESESDSGSFARGGTRTTSTRRQLLRWGSVGGLWLLAGCTEDVGEEFPSNRKWPVSELTPSLPVRERTEVLEERIEAVADETITDEEEFADAFDDYALEIESVDRSQDVLEVEYVNTRLYAEGNLHDIGPIAGAFAALVDSGYDAVTLGITILDGAPASYGSAEVHADWAHRYNDGDLSAAEYGELVTTTLESKRDSPSVEVSPDE
ncbi:hypothetical protein CHINAEXTREME_20155 [Halobiforma lacisalsi AJ5]|uniref:DUF8159 domain-containing protein n=1 Tax=Natronobacterium lacisalsi AJ5 TaxID=358396 RepID=M0LQV3_NATLA|nr:hypothetical protein [Halobiforma lacisalsi]APW99939.1 hypothetical protein CHINAEXTREME_20155 [Halobiforma lacisalsi AJ5]EMA35871.1 hypothetical protein C445_03408 [Halobiforma lacisalsi AJ5]